MNAQDKKTALIVEDELFIVLELEETLQELGYDEVVTFSKIDAAMSWLKSVAPAIAIIDYHLKDEIADELIRTLADLTVPTVVYSGRSPDPDADNDMLKACEWLTKPADQRMLAMAITRACGLAEPATIR
ncbi:response regulator [Rhizobium metallidurans]|uniref:DNA-binding NtrC family response regulator n=1 Tax=Rhizobium metallidurans TaxID=1265931 RepID=A0A7W6CUY9_9HYPH|nr:response regulator [Rhizobium metallidurans]MBB3965392.1 DNA-binding NtrC family response regulator [Rhizobium metallidurans]